MQVAEKPLSQQVVRFTEASGFTLIASEQLTVSREGFRAHCKAISPFVWREDDSYRCIFRMVPRRNAKDIQSRLVPAHGDGVHFTLEDESMLAAGDASDADGCEDPTVLKGDSSYIVFYTAVSDDGGQSNLSWAEGKRLNSLEKRGRVTIDPTCNYSKEVACFEKPGGTHVFYFEGTSDGCSIVSAAYEDGAIDRWNDAHSVLEPRSDYWDCHHVSTGPVIDVDGRHVMFYNGCDDQGRWRTGVARMNPDSGAVEYRSDVPLFESLPAQGNLPDIVFSSSALWSDGDLWLYYTRGDAQACRLRLSLSRPDQASRAQKPAGHINQD